ncbi:HYDIN protein, partial [Erpornis zantholeuca]|nr:HYDIN protein [Erpornis zantholeuca]
LINKSPIDAPFTVVSSTSDMAGCFKFEPEHGIIDPCRRQRIQISFDAKVIAWFNEEFQFKVTGCPTPAILLIEGCVDGPQLHLDVEEIDFCDIAFGFPYTRTFRLTSTSPVSVTFSLRVPDDGTEPSVSCFDMMRDNANPAWRKGVHCYVEQKEFTMTPSRGTILPHTYQDIEVTLCSNTVMEYYRKIMVDVEGFGKGVVSVLIKARCLLPALRVFPDFVDCSHLFLNDPHVVKVYIRNIGPIPGCYGLIAQERNADTPVFFSSPTPCGIVGPYCIVELPIVLRVQKVGKQSTIV